MKLGALIVSYNSGEHLARCLRACQRYSAEFSAGILVVDNASTDRSLAIAAEHGVPTLVQPQNQGFAAAVNAGFRQLSTADAILILNPDAEPQTSPAVLAAGLADETVAAAAGRLINADGQPQRGFQLRRLPTVAALVCENLGVNRLWHSNPVNRHYRCLDLDERQPADVEQPAGACLLVRRRAWLDVGGLDPAFYPVWFEDVDFCARLLAAGWRIRYEPSFTAQHAGGHSVSALSRSDRAVYWYGSLLRYTSKHLRTSGLGLGYGFVGTAVIVGCVLRSVTGMVCNKTSQPWSIVCKVLRLVWSYSGMRHKMVRPSGDARQVVS